MVYNTNIGNEFFKYKIYKLYLFKMTKDAIHIASSVGGSTYYRD